MIKYIYASLFVFSLLLVPLGVHAEVSAAQQTQLQSQIDTIASAINANDAQAVTRIISPNAREELASEIQSALSDESIQFEQQISSYEEIENNRVRVNGRFSARGTGWYSEGFSNFYTFEQRQNAWLLVDTNFHEKIGPTSIFEMLRNMFVIVVTISLFTGAFWLWMLIDCIKRDFNDKTLWILIIVFCNFFGALLYFIIKRRSLKNQQPKELESPRITQLAQYIQEYISKGYTKQQLREYLLEQNYSEDDISQAMKRIK